MATNNIIDINISGAEKSKIRINGDDNLIIYLNTSDMGIISRLKESISRMDDIEKKLNELDLDNEDETPEALDTFTEKYNEFDSAMRDVINYIFDSDVCTVCVAGGTMFDPVNGDFRFNHILNTLTKLYETNIQNEYSQLQKKLSKHTAKYTKKK